MTNETLSALTRFDELAEGYEGWFASPLGAFVARLERDLILKLLRPKPGERVLEVGSGTGFFLREVARSGAICVGVDPSAEMLAVAMAHPAETVTHVRGCGEALPFPPATFDAVLYMTTLEFVQDEGAAVMEAARVVRPGGRLVFGVLNSDGPWASARTREGGLWDAARFYDRRELEALLRPLGALTVDYCVHVPPRLGGLARPLLRVADAALRLTRRGSGALIGVRVDVGR
jgi:ubiquinone/menaquinone biosynthesis C-methylase UbiE